MKFDWKLLIIIGLSAIVGFIIYFQVFGEIPEYLIEPLSWVKERVGLGAKPPKATGDIDGAVAAIIQSSSGEQTLLAEEENDSSLISLDSQAIDDLGKSYDPNEF